MKTPVQIKICGVTSVKDAGACAECGADMVGLNFFSKSPRYVELKTAQRIVEAMAGRVQAVGVFVGDNAGEVRTVANAAGIRIVQLHGDFPPGVCRELAHEFRVIRAFSTDDYFRPEAVSLFPECDVLVDAYHPTLRGGTGQICDWPVARATLPFTRFLILSGGLNAENVAPAIDGVGPHAVDVCSSVETILGTKNRRALENFIAAVRRSKHPVNSFSSP